MNLPMTAAQRAGITAKTIAADDRFAHLTPVEKNTLTRYAEAYRFYRYGRTIDFGAALERLVRPLNDALDYTGIGTNKRKYVLLFILREMAERKQSFWGWTTVEWIDSIDSRLAARQHAAAVAYLLCGFSELHRLKSDSCCVFLPRTKGIWLRAYEEDV
jgi:hypothetical protein